MLGLPPGVPAGASDDEPRLVEVVPPRSGGSPYEVGRPDREWTIKMFALLAESWDVDGPHATRDSRWCDTTGSSFVSASPPDGLLAGFNHARNESGLIELSWQQIRQLMSPPLRAGNQAVAAAPAHVDAAPPLDAAQWVLPASAMPSVAPVAPPVEQPPTLQAEQPVDGAPVASLDASSVPSGAFGKAFLDARHFPDWPPLDRESTGWDVVIWRERTVRGEHQYQITFPSEPHVRRQYYRADQLTEVRLAPSAAGQQILSVIHSHTPVSYTHLTLPTKRIV